MVQWHWLRPTTFKPRERFSRFKSTESILETAGLLTDKSWGAGLLAHRESGIPTRTGQIFTIKADKAEDLPSWDFLELVESLRVAAICGTADVPSPYWDEESDDEYEEWPQHAIDAAIVARAAEITARQSLANTSETAPL